MAISKAQQKATSTYVRNNYDRLEVKVSKGKKQIIQEVANTAGESLNGYIKKAIKKQVEYDTGNDIEL